MLFLRVFGCQKRGGNSGKGLVTQGWGVLGGLGTGNDAFVPTVGQMEGKSPGGLVGSSHPAQQQVSN